MIDGLREVVRTGGRLCVSCVSSGSCRYGVDRLRFDDAGDVMHANTLCLLGDEGGPGTAHGGWICAVFDELMGQHVTERHGQVVTAEIVVSFRKPVAVGVRLAGTSWLEPIDGRKVKARGQLCLDGDDRVLATATGLFVRTQADHYQRLVKS